MRRTSGIIIGCCEPVTGTVPAGTGSITITGLYDLVTGLRRDVTVTVTVGSTTPAALADAWVAALNNGLASVGGGAARTGYLSFGNFVYYVPNPIEAPALTAVISQFAQFYGHAVRPAPDQVAAADYNALSDVCAATEGEVSALEAQLAAAGAGGGETAAPGSVNVSVNQPVNNGATVLAALSGIVVGQMIGRGVPFQQNEED